AAEDEVGARAVGVERRDRDPPAALGEIAVLLPDHVDVLLHPAVDHPEADVDLVAAGDREAVGLAGAAVLADPRAQPDLVDVDAALADAAEGRAVVDRQRQAAKD